MEKADLVPELPEVETVRRGLAPFLEGALIECVDLKRGDLRFPFPRGFAAKLKGQRVEALRRRGKYLLADIGADWTLVIHLGMSGSFRMEGADPVAGNARHYRASKDAKHDHVVMRLRGGPRLVYNDPRRFGFMLLVRRSEIDRHPLLEKLGAEPTGNALSAKGLAPCFTGRAAPLKAVLSDQHVIAGLGNIYVCEALWRARLSPRRRAGSLVRADQSPTDRLVRLVDAVRAVIADAIEAGGSSLRDYVHADGTLGLFQHRFAVYDRDEESCLRQGCSGRIRRIVQSGRSTFYCPACQR